MADGYVEHPNGSVGMTEPTAALRFVEREISDGQTAHIARILQQAFRTITTDRHGYAVLTDEWRDVPLEKE